MDEWVCEKSDIYRNIKYVVMLNARLGYRCGYVQIKENSPLYEQSFTDIELNTRAITFSGHIKDISGWFIGWDYHNSNDGIDVNVVKEYYKDLPKIEQYEKVCYAKSFGNEDGIVASCNRVEEDCQNVIEELLNRGY